MLITFEVSKFETGRAIALAHAMNALSTIDDDGTTGWTAENVFEYFGRAGIIEKLKDYQEFIFAGTC